MSDEKSVKRILIIDDEKGIAELLAIRLRQLGYEIDIANDGEEGLEKIKATKPDLVLLDLMMPKLDGRDLLKIVKKVFHFKTSFVRLSQAY